jgi:glycogen operon protein
MPAISAFCWTRARRRPASAAPGSDATLLLILNAYHDVVRFHLPEVVGGASWELLVDTNVPELEEQPAFPFGHD